jgi:fatty acid desaturase
MSEQLEPESTAAANDTHDTIEFDSLRWRLFFLLFPSITGITVCWYGTWPWLEAVIVAWTSYFFLCGTSMFHEFTHRHTHPRCRGWARVIGTLILIPATAYRESHVRHHAYLNKPVDWELWPYSDPQRSRLFRIVFAWIDLFAGFLTSPLIYGRIYWHRHSPLPPKSRTAIAWEYLGILVFWGAALAIIGSCSQWTGFLRAWVLPWGLAGILQTGRKFTEHLGMSSYDPLRGTRTVYGGGLLTRVCSYLNADIFIHGPHHRSPKVTADELHAFARSLQQQTGEDPLPFFTSYAAATRNMLPHLLLNPGVGENARTHRTDSPAASVEIAT